VLLGAVATSEEAGLIRFALDSDRSALIVLDHSEQFTLECISGERKMSSHPA
jgi:hypothetical protein